jgi:hypothetical protein
MGADQAGGMIEMTGRGLEVNGHRTVLAAGRIVIVRGERVQGGGQLDEGS